MGEPKQRTKQQSFTKGQALANTQVRRSSQLWCLALRPSFSEADARRPTFSGPEAGEDPLAREGDNRKASPEPESQHTFQWPGAMHSLLWAQGAKFHLRFCKLLLSGTLPV